MNYFGGFWRQFVIITACTNACDDCGSFMGCGWKTLIIVKYQGEMQFKQET